MSEETTFELKIEEQIGRIDEAVDEIRSLKLAGTDVVTFVLSIRSFLRDLSARELCAYNPYEMHPQGQKFFPCMYKVIITKKVAQSKSDELNKTLTKGERGEE